MPEKTLFGLTPEGEEVFRISISNDGLSCDILTYGATVQSLRLPDKNGNVLDVVLGYDSLQEYIDNDGYFGALVGRYANRIAKGSFSLNGEEYSLAVNNGPNALHGGIRGFSMRVWDICAMTENSLSLHLKSPHMEEGYPGELDVTVSYTIADNALSIDYELLCDRDTVCNLTNHSYFNLDGHASGSALGNFVRINASRFTPADATSIPTGELAGVQGTPMDFLSPHTLAERIDADFEQLKLGQGYDHNYVIDGWNGSLTEAACAYSEQSGISMSVRTTMPGMQLYTANFIPSGRPGKGGASYDARHAYCFETQFFPDSPNNPQFPSCVVKAGEKHSYSTVYAFGLEK